MNTITVLSFDIGIKNLAFCIIKFSNEDFEIIKWEIINLDDNKIKCSYIKKNGNQCILDATKILKLNNKNNTYYCKKHNNKQIDIRNVDINWKESKTDKSCLLCNNNGLFKSNLIKDIFCSKHYMKKKNNKNICVIPYCNELINKGLYYDDNIFIGWCELHFKENYFKFIKKKTKTIKQNCNKSSLTILCRKMFEKLDMIPELLQVDHVLIENQPTFINPTMKTISVMLFSYFIYKGIHKKEKNKSIIQTVNFCSPIKKKYLSQIKNIYKIKNNYKLTKKINIEICKLIISEKSKYICMFNKYKKKDDLADSLLQGYIWMYKKIPNKYLKINI